MGFRAGYIQRGYQDDLQYKYVNQIVVDMLKVVIKYDVPLMIIGCCRKGCIDLMVI